jgi:hypothetical protein
MPSIRERPSPPRALAVLSLIAVVCTAVPACRKQEKPNGNRDAEKNRENLMKEMDRIQAEEEAKHKATPETPTPTNHSDPQPVPEKKP